MQAHLALPMGAYEFVSNTGFIGTSISLSNSDLRLQSTTTDLTDLNGETAWLRA